jgi:nitrite reductase/ring-hydroxylating ferredoxin subunit
MLSSLDRRYFLHRFIVGSAGSFLAGQVWSGRMLGELLEGPPGVLTVRVSEYPALQSVHGSMQLIFTDLVHPVLINRGPGDIFYAMDSDCQHAHCVVRTYDHAAGGTICSCHGSIYAIDGARVFGPTERGLNRFAAIYDGVDTLSITIPGLGFSITQIAVQSVTGSAQRLRLQTDLPAYTRYRVVFRRQLSDAPEFVPFATTPTGPANIESGYATSSPTTIYVEATGDRGSYTIVLVATPYL